MILAVRYTPNDNLVYLRNTSNFSAGERAVPLDRAKGLSGMFDTAVDNKYYERSLEWVLSTPPERQERILVATGDYDESEHRWSKLKALSTFGKQYTVSLSLLGKLQVDKDKQDLYRDLRLYKTLNTRKVVQGHAIYGTDYNYDTYGVETYLNLTPKKIIVDYNKETSIPHIPITTQNGAPCFLWECSILSSLACIVKNQQYTPISSNGSIENLLEMFTLKGKQRSDRIIVNTGALETAYYLLGLDKITYPCLDLDKLLETVEYLESGYDNPYPMYLLPLLNWLYSKDGNLQFIGANLDLRIFKDYAEHQKEREDSLSLFTSINKDVGESLIVDDTFYALNPTANADPSLSVIDLRSVKKVTGFAIWERYYRNEPIKYYWIDSAMKSLNLTKECGKVGFLLDTVSEKTLQQMRQSGMVGLTEEKYNIKNWLEHPEAFKRLLCDFIMTYVFTYCNTYLFWEIPEEPPMPLWNLGRFVSVTNEESHRNGVYSYHSVIGDEYELWLRNQRLSWTYWGVLGVSGYDALASSGRDTERYAKLGYYALYYTLDALGYKRFTGKEETYKIVSVENVKLSTAGEHTANRLVGNMAVYFLGKTDMVVKLDRAVPICTDLNILLPTRVDNSPNFFDGVTPDIGLKNECLDRIFEVATQEKPVGRTVILRSQEEPEMVSKINKYLGSLRDAGRN